MSNIGYRTRKVGDSDELSQQSRLVHLVCAVGRQTKRKRRTAAGTATCELRPESSSEFARSTTNEVQRKPGYRRRSEEFVARGPSKTHVPEISDHYVGVPQ